MKEYDIIFPGKSYGMAYKDRKIVKQRGITLLLYACDESFYKSKHMLNIHCINSREAETPNLRLCVPAHSETLDTIIKVLKDFKGYVDSGEEVPYSHEKIQIKEG